MRHIDGLWLATAAPPRRGVVLDPFLGSGTTGEIALKLGRNFIGIDLYEEYIDMADKRCQETLNWLEANKIDATTLEH